MVSPPATTPTGTPRKPPPICSDDGFQTEPEPEPSNKQFEQVNQRLESENRKLKAELEEVEAEREKIMNAHLTLQDKYRKDKLRWGKWVETDQQRRDSSKKRLRDGTGRHMTSSPGPRRPQTGLSSSPPRPVLSPASPSNPKYNLGPLKKGGLFSGLQLPKVPSFPQESRNPQGNGFELDPTPSDAMSIPETPEREQLQLPTLPTTGPIGQNEHEGHPESDATTSDIGDDTEITPRAIKTEPGNEPMLPPAPIFNPNEAGTRSRPFFIKEEPMSSQSDHGYYINDQESLDLDDVCQRGEGPKKKRKMEILARENSKKTSNEADNHESGNKELLPPLRREDGYPAAIPGAQPNNDEDNLPPPRTRVSQMSLAAANRNRSAPSEARRSVQTTPTTPNNSRRGPITTSASNPPKQPRSHGKALASVLEDGTDGFSQTQALEANEKDPEKDPTADQPSRLDILLNTPPVGTHSLRPLGKEVNMRSAPMNKRSRWGGIEDATTPSNTTKNNVGKRQAVMDSFLTGKQPTDVAGRQIKNSDSRTTAESVNDFRINPAANEGLDYAFLETVRRRDERKCLPGCTRTCCRDIGKFLEAAGLPPVHRDGPRWRSSSPPKSRNDGEQGIEELKQKFVDNYGRHKEAFPRRKTPPLFWASDMPTTQELQRQHEDAERIEAEKIVHRRREAEKGDKGRYIRR